MTEEEALARLNAIRRLAQVDDPDHEDLHTREDRFYRDVLTAIATGDVADPAKLAAIALRTRKLKFERWTA